ncbi:MAG: zinc metalloprotease, partial [Bacteroidota bacterium]
MRTRFLILSFVLLSIWSCSKNDQALQNQEDVNTKNEIAPQVAARRNCMSHEMLQEQLKADAGLAKLMRAIEEVTERVLKNPSSYRLLADGTIEIPCHVNVLYRTTAENISNAQIQSQIDVLNEDFAGTNADRTLLPSLFSSV